MKNSGKHRSGQVKTLFWPVAGMLSALAGIPVGGAAMIELYRYSPYGDRAALDIAIRLGVSALLMMVIPLAAAACHTVLGWSREYRAWKQTLTPGQRLAASVAELAALEVMHRALHDHNREVSDRLTASVMGEPRGSDQAQ